MNLIYDQIYVFHGILDIFVYVPCTLVHVTGVDTTYVFLGTGTFIKFILQDIITSVLKIQNVRDRIYPDGIFCSDQIDQIIFYHLSFSVILQFLFYRTVFDRRTYSKNVTCYTVRGLVKTPIDSVPDNEMILLIFLDVISTVNVNGYCKV
ncbi:hypothetical protein [Salmon gill poxvirus]|nr:hypothetical protein [Salmon gill poxvirus]